MPRLAIVYGLLCIVIGLAGYFVAAAQQDQRPAGAPAIDPMTNQPKDYSLSEEGGVSPTALIPVGIGVVAAALGVIGLKPGARKHAMHAAAALGVLAIFGTASFGLTLVRAMAGQEMERPIAVASGVAVLAASIAFVIACIGSFVRARRQAGASSEPS